MRQKYNLAPLVFIVLSLVQIGCKENVILPSSLVPAVDNVNTFATDTVTVITSTDYQDSLLTGGLYKSTDKNAQANFYHPLGTISSDPVFGKTIAKAYVTVVPPKDNFTFSGRNQVIDSVVLSIPYVASYADTFGTSVPQKFYLYQTDKFYTKDSAYFENKHVEFAFNNLLSSKTFNFYKANIDSPIVNGIKQVPQLRFTLPKWIGDSMLHDTAALCKSSTIFLNWLKGFYIVPDSSKGNTLGYFNTLKTKMYIHYRDSSLTIPLKIDTTVDVFSFDTKSCSRFGTITRDYSLASAKPFIQTGNTRGDELTFSQGVPGLATIIEFPFIDSFKLSAINKAELILTCPPSFTTQFDTTIYGLPLRLLIFREENGEEKILNEYSDFDKYVSYFSDGFKKTVTINGTNYVQYKFILTSTIQKAIINKNGKFKLKITSASASLPMLGRSVFYGSNSSSLLKPKINIIFTNLH